MDFALLFPGEFATYLFRIKEPRERMHATLEYYRMYRIALFGVTMRRGGFDAFRHTEILASGAVPFFIGLDSVPNHTLAHHRKDLLRAARSLRGTHVGYLDASFDAERYL